MRGAGDILLVPLEINTCTVEVAQYDDGGVRVQLILLFDVTWRPLP